MSDNKKLLLTYILALLFLVGGTSCKNKADDCDYSNLHPPPSSNPDPGGLPNIGNTCYMNAALQLFAAVDEYATMFLKPDDALGTKEKTLANKGAVIMQKIRANELIDEAVMKAFYTALKACGWPYGVGTQQDTEEFMTFVLDKLQSKQLIQLQNRIIPDGGAEALGHVESIHMLYLTIKSASTMSAAMQLFFITEKLTADNKYYDVSQGKQVDVTKQQLLANLPNPLLIQLRQVDYIAGKIIKIETSLSDPLQGLQIPKQILPIGTTISPDYNLQAFVEHIGSTVTSGHYIAYVYRTRNGETAWWCYNDARVTKKTDEEVKNAASKSYVYAYKHP